LINFGHHYADIQTYTRRQIDGFLAAIEALNKLTNSE